MADTAGTKWLVYDKAPSIWYYWTTEPALMTYLSPWFLAASTRGHNKIKQPILYCMPSYIYPLDSIGKYNILSFIIESGKMSEFWVPMLKSSKFTESTLSPLEVLVYLPKLKTHLGKTNTNLRKFGWLCIAGNGYGWKRLPISAQLALGGWGNGLSSLDLIFYTKHMVFFHEFHKLV